MTSNGVTLIESLPFFTKPLLFFTCQQINDMKILLFFLIAFFAAFLIHAQPQYEKVDSFARNFKASYTDAADLARQLTAPFQTDGEKARALFAWVAENIRYDYAKYKDGLSKVRFSGQTIEEMEQQKQEWHEDQIRATLRKKKGVCSDYSRLYQRMCDVAGVECVTISGLTRSLRGRGGRHAWNAVRIDGKWRLVDATWGAGYIDDDTDKFIRRFSPGFFDTPPELLILDHLPNEEKWQLLDQPVSKADFKKQPLVNYGSGDFGLQAFAPADGKLHKTNGKAEIRLKLGNPPPALRVVAGMRREIPAEVEKTDDGWTVLTFSPGMASDIHVFGGKGRKLQWLARF